jgi:CheY-like chemotaxis protein/two-component sensor histidine kinase
MQPIHHPSPRDDQFLATLAHELRNPLAPMRHCVDILERTVDDERSRGVLEVMDRQLRHMARLVDELMDVSRLTRGMIELHRETFDASTMLDVALEASRPLIDAGQHALTVRKPAPPVMVEGDCVRLAQAITNLLNNAARFTEPGGHIELSALEEGDDLVVRVADTGIGISAEALPAVFELFSQADQRALRAQNGLGIGLTLVRAIVELHGGTVTAQSEGTGCGSVFTLRLPVREAAQREAHARAGRPAEPPPQRILVVDDNRDAADMLAKLLRMSGAEVEVVYDGPSALEAVERFKPRAVVLDLGMPGMSGFDVAVWIRERHAFDGVKLIALSGWSQESDRQRTSEVGFDHHLAKPADVETVQALLDAAA